MGRGNNCSVWELEVNTLQTNTVDLPPGCNYKIMFVDASDFADCGALSRKLTDFG